MAFKYEFERPGLTVDCVIFGLDLEEETLKVMLIERDIEPLRFYCCQENRFYPSQKLLSRSGVRQYSHQSEVVPVLAVAA